MAIVRINGSEVSIADQEVTYEQLISMSGFSGNPSATCWIPGKQGLALYCGKSVAVIDGMTFTVMHTSCS